MSRPRVSCILPTRDRAALVAEAVASVLAQTHPVELLVIDDGSTDDTAAVLADVAARAQTATAFRLLRTEAVGVAGARNAGLQAARGELVAFLDSDDAWHPDKIARQLAVMAARPELALTFTDYEMREPDGAGGERLLATRRFEGEPSLARLLQRNFIGTLTVMAHRDALLAEGGFAAELVRGSDYDLWLRLSRRHPIARVPGVLARYRWHPGSLTGASRRRNTQNYIDVVTRLAALDPELFVQAGADPGLLVAAARQRMAEAA